VSRFAVEYTPEAILQIRKLDGSGRKILKAWIEKNLVNCEDPRANGKALTGDKRGYWRYRVGNYRILALIIDDRLVIQIFKVGHRRSVYRK
jgi:mRNA interferase RelE/StbE